MTGDIVGNEYDRLLDLLQNSYDAIGGNMFGKKCIKTHGKACIALFSGAMVFKLIGDSHQNALALSDSCLWDPSGKKRYMKEWVQIHAKHISTYETYAYAAMAYVSGEMCISNHNIVS